MMLEVERVVVKTSHVGRGVFAESTLRAEELIGEVQGKIIDDGQYGSDYTVDLSGGFVMEPHEPFRFLNHSCEPNCELTLWGQRRIGERRHYRLWLQTLRPIAAGEELTIDYCWPASAAIACRCGSVRCRGWIVHPDELQELTMANGTGSNTGMKA